MHIKQITISGFRSFRSQAETEPFSARHNVIVGRNGSGKSNFFDAIQFVLLHQKFQSLRQDERQHLLHEGAGANVMSAFVEILFDNSDGRLPIDGDEVVLRRTIGLKKDEIFLNRKRVTKQEVSSLLESAGFSKSNPYYIVQQGKVSALTMMRDSERLNLLKEVAGTKVYEDRRSESLKIMADSAEKRARIQDVITYIETRLQELEGEKDELGAYQQLDRERRALEYTLYDKELRSARDGLDAIEETSSDAAQIEELHDSLRAVRDSISKSESDLAQYVRRTSKLEREKAEVESERSDVMAKRAALEIEVKEIIESVSADSEAQTYYATELEDLERTVAAKEAEMERVVAPAHDAAQKASKAAESRLAEATAEAEDLYARQSRHSQFSSAAERDNALRKQVKSVKKAAESKRASAHSMETAAHEMQGQVRKLQQRASELEQDISDRRRQCAMVAETIAERISARDAMAESRKERWRTLEEVEDRISELKSQWEQGKRDLRASTPRAIGEGLENLQRIIKEENIRGVYGPVIENFELENPKYTTAVEVAAGNSLFNVIVDTDETAARLVERLERGRLGRLTFMPLNRLQPILVNCPDSPDVIPLLQVALRYENVVAPAMKQVFGRKLLASSLTTAASAAESAGADAVTLDGDEVGRKGGISGGYRDYNTSRLRAVNTVRSVAVSLKAATSEQSALREKVSEADQAVTNILGEIQKLEAKRDNAKHLIGADSSELTIVRRQIASAEKAFTEQIEVLPALFDEADQEDAHAALLEREIGTPLQAGLPPELKARLTELNTTVLPSLRQDLQDRYKELELAAVEKQKLEALLRSHLQARRSDLRARLAPQHGGFGGDKNAAAAAMRTEDLALRRGELVAVTRALEDNRGRLARVENELLEGKQAIRKLQDELESLRLREARDAEVLGDVSKMAERLLGKRTLLIAKKETNTRKIQELGSLPAAELQRFAPLGPKALMKKLHEVNECLKQYSHVNKKALDQFVSFSEQREELLTRQSDLNKGDDAIQELISTLDRQKDETIQNTFRSVSKHFSEVFQELVPRGTGKLVILTRADENASDEEEEQTMESGNFYSISQYTGVQVRVSFTGAGEAHLMSQLSGGQKALVALALIFAIQRCDPAPFYLLDEIDQALDSSYRGALAALIERQANSKDNTTQFITTTFRPELVQVASRAYGISHQNKVSNIELMTRDEALGFVAEILNEEEAVGTKLAQPTTQRRTVMTTRQEQHESSSSNDENESPSDDSDSNSNSDVEIKVTSRSNVKRHRG